MEENQSKLMFGGRKSIWNHNINRRFYQQGCSKEKNEPQRSLSMVQRPSKQEELWEALKIKNINTVVGGRKTQVEDNWECAVVRKESKNRIQKGILERECC